MSVFRSFDSRSCEPPVFASFLLRLALILFVVSGVVASSSGAAYAQSIASLQMVMGNPSGATADTNNSLNYLMQKNQYALSYNQLHATPNWVSWHLGSADLGSAGRSDAFAPDTTLPSNWYKVTTSDYSGSGYDRGHNCPSGDRTASDNDNKATFLMTNMVPQEGDNNQGPWATLENYCRSLVNSGNELFIISCPNTYSSKTIAGGKVYVPGYMSKVIVVLPKGSSLSASSVTTATRVICVDMPNIAGIRSNAWQNYIISVDQLEAYTGYDFLSNVSPSVQAVVEARVDSAFTAGTSPRVSIGATSVLEGDTGDSNMLGFPVTLSTAAISNVNVKYSTSDITATAGSDYVGVTNANLNIRSGQNAGTIVVPVIGDNDFEANETMRVTLSSPSNATLGTSSAIGTITNDDTAAPTPTPTATATPTATPRPTATSTPTPTATATATPLPTASPTPTATSTPVPTATPTSTPVPTPTSTSTPVPTATPTATPAPTATATPAPTATPTPTATVGPTATPTATAEPTATPTATATAAPTATPTATSIPTATPTATATAVPTATPTATATPTPTATPQPTATATPLPTATPVAVPRISVTFSPTAPRTNDVLRTVVTSSTDRMPTLRYQWYKGTVLLEGQTGNALNLSRVGLGDKGELIIVRVTPYIGTTAGLSVTARVTVLNTPPVATSFNAYAKGGVPVDVPLQASDTDGDNLAFSLSAPVAGGTATFFTKDGKPYMRYSPRPTTSGQDIVRFKVMDTSKAVVEAAVTFTVTPNAVPTLVSITPSSGTVPVGRTTIWTQIVKDTDGPLDLDTVYFLLSPAPRAAESRNGVFVAYNVPSKTWAMMGDDGRTWGEPVALGATLENSRASIYLPTNGATLNRDGSLFLRWWITPKVGFTGVKTIFGRVQDIAIQADGLRQVGSVTFGSAATTKSEPSFSGGAS